MGRPGYSSRLNSFVGIFDVVKNGQTVVDGSFSRNEKISNVVTRRSLSWRPADDLNVQVSGWGVAHLGMTEP